jgi:hypothetical protein
MDPYTFGLTLGSVGLGVMALSGFAQATHAGHAHTHGHAGHGHTHGGHAHGHSHGEPALLAASLGGGENAPPAFPGPTR